MTERLRAALGGGFVLLDAAMGTRLVALGLRLGEDDPALWNLSRPDDVLDVHRRDVAAGSQALLTNSFGANRSWLARYGHADEVGPINRLAVGLAREAAGGDRLVIGSVGPTAGTAPGVYLEQAEALADAGADALLFETHRLDQAETALRAVGRTLAIPLLVSLMAWPERPELDAAVRRLADLGASALGGNCQDGPEPALEMAEALRGVTDVPLFVKPAAGLPGRPLAGPERFARTAARLRTLRPVLAGGCCGTTEAHVAAIRAGWYDASDLEEGETGRHRGMTS